jgi:uncharacterized protein (DUF305 family)
MHTRVMIWIILIFLFGIFLSYAVGNDSGHDSHGDLTSTSTQSNTNVHDTHNGMDHDTLTISTERTFLEHMIPHHQEAVDAAREFLARGATTEQIKTLAEGIVTAQELEIAAMKAWYTDWYSADLPNANSYQPMMRDLLSLSGTDLDRAFLEDMIKHHEGAVAIAEAARAYSTHPEIMLLLENIITTQNSEIILMKSLHASLSTTTE